MSPVFYLLDENVDPIYRTELLRRKPDLIVWKVGDPGAPPLGTLDPAILKWCEEHGFLLATNNRRSMPRHLRDHIAEGSHVPGVLVFNPNDPIGGTLDDLLLIVAASDISEYHDRVVYLPL